MGALGYLLIAASLPSVAIAASAQQIALNISPAQLVREVVHNELEDHQFHGYWRYWIERHTASGDSLEQQIETPAGPVSVLERDASQPLGTAARAAEQKRLRLLLASPQTQAEHQRQYQQDEDRIGRIVALLPEAFLFDFDGFENGSYRLRFYPNPAYAAHSVEARILHGMNGRIWIDARYKHLARLEGQIDHNIDFGFGLLGRIYKGGWFQLERTRVGANDWKTSRLEVHMNVRALLVTSIARETSEKRGGFLPVPSSTTLAVAVALLSERSAELSPPPSALASAVLCPDRQAGQNASSLYTSASKQDTLTRFRTPTHEKH